MQRLTPHYLCSTVKLLIYYSQLYAASCCNIIRNHRQRTFVRWFCCGFPEYTFSGYVLHVKVPGERNRERSSFQG